MKLPKPSSSTLSECQNSCFDCSFAVTCDVEDGVAPCRVWCRTLNHFTALSDLLLDFVMSLDDFKYILLEQLLKFRNHISSVTIVLIISYMLYFTRLTLWWRSPFNLPLSFPTRCARLVREVPLVQLEAEGSEQDLPACLRRRPFHPRSEHRTGR